MGARFVPHIHWLNRGTDAVFPRRPKNETPLLFAADGYYFLRGKNFSDAFDGVPPDCAFSRDRHRPDMPEPNSLSLSPQDKLDALRMLDEFHLWRSLDDVRFCTECHRSFTGWAVQVIESKGTRGRLHLQCTTEGCLALPSQWVEDDPVRAAAFRGGTGSFRSPRAPAHGRVTVSHHG
jgi:hypothetical protein